MIEALQFTVLGTPQAQGSMKRTRHGGMTHSNPKLKRWREDVGWAAKAAILPYAEKRWVMDKHIPVRLECDFYFERPKSVLASRLFPVVPPDDDKLLRAVGDALSGILWLDDAQLVEVTGRKFYGTPARAKITVRFAATEPASL